MPSIFVNDKEIKITDTGYLIHSEDWTEDVALELARFNGNTIKCLTDKQLLLLRFVRENTKKGRLPKIADILEKTELTISDIFTSFNKGYYISVSKIAGLEEPNCGCSNAKE